MWGVAVHSVQAGIGGRRTDGRPCPLNWTVRHTWPTVLVDQVAKQADGHRPYVHVGCGTAHYAWKQNNPDFTGTEKYKLRCLQAIVGRAK